jgi:hypothetical protein
MDLVIDRIVKTYDLLANRTAALSDEAMEKLTTYLAMLTEAGERDQNRLAVCGLTYLRQLDGTTDPVKSGFTGL